MDTFLDYDTVRRKTRPVSVGGVEIGGSAPVSVQSMTKTDTRDVAATVNQIHALEAAGCEIIRVAVPDEEAVEALVSIIPQISIPLIADIHFDFRLALLAVAAGVDGLRINPGNIGGAARVREVTAAAAERSVPIRIGVNAGSLEKDFLQKYGGATAEAMVESALRHIRILEDLSFDRIKVSLKASDIGRTLEAYRLLAAKVDYPFHAGITEAGGLTAGTVKSSIGLGLLLTEGLVDTLRVSLTADPVEEVRVGRLVLSSLNIRTFGPQIVSCPTCGRCEVDLQSIADAVEKRILGIKTALHVAVMGCMVNGPGEAKDADIGVACGKGVGVIFKRGEVLRRVEEEKIVDVFVEEVERMAEEESRDSK